MKMAAATNRIDMEGRGENQFGGELDGVPQATPANKV
jgi:hypothetical protein